MNLFSLRWLAALMGLMALPTWAAPNSAQITVRATVVDAPACVINNNQPINVNFGNAVNTALVNGSNYQRPVNYSVSCSRAGGMKLKIVGTGASFDGNALQTGNRGLAIALSNGGTRVPLNSWINFTYPSIPNLTATPVKQAGGRLIAGVFSAAATMMVDYQ